MRRRLVNPSLNQIHRLVRNQDGAALVQYALLLALIATMVASAASRLLPNIQSDVHYLLAIFGITGA